jgi:hypothetical protein
MAKSKDKETPNMEKAIQGNYDNVATEQVNHDAEAAIEAKQEQPVNAEETAKAGEAAQEQSDEVEETAKAGEATQEQPAMSEDEKKSLEIMKNNNINKVYKVGKCWFTRLSYAESESKKSGNKLETFEK